VGGEEKRLDNEQGSRITPGLSFSAEGLTTRSTTEVVDDPSRSVRSAERSNEG